MRDCGATVNKVRADSVDDRHYERLSLKISDNSLRRLRRQKREEEMTVTTHQSVGFMLSVHQDSSAAPLCHLHGRSCIPVSGGTRDGGDACGPGLVWVTWWVRTAAVVWLAVWASAPEVQTTEGVKWKMAFVAKAWWIVFLCALCHEAQLLFRNWWEHIKEPHCLKTAR